MKLTCFGVLICFFSLTAAVISCTSSKDGKSDGTIDETPDPISGVMYSIPNPSEIAALISSTGAEFDERLINEKSNAEGYLTTDKAAINLGVFASDIGYLITYQKTQQAIDYTDACRGLADRIGQLGTIEQEFIQKIENNIDNKDSLAKTLDNSMQKIQEYLRSEGRERLGALLVTGSFVEGLYIATGLIKNYPADIPAQVKDDVLIPLIRTILDQEKSVDEVMRMLVDQEQTEPLPTLLVDLKSLQSSYRAVNFDDLLKEGNSGVFLTDKNLVDITKAVEKIRTDIVKAK